MGPAPRDPGSVAHRDSGSRRISSGARVAQPGSSPARRARCVGHPGASVPRARRPGLTRSPGRPPPSAPPGPQLPRGWCRASHPAVQGRAPCPPPQEETGAPTHRGASLALPRRCPWPQPRSRATSPSAAGLVARQGAAHRRSHRRTACYCKLRRPGSSCPGPPTPPLSQLGEPDRGAPQHKLCERAPSPALPARAHSTAPPP